MVVQRNHDLPAVIGVDYADLVRRGKAALCGKAASGIHKSGEAAWQFDGKPRVNHCGFPGGDAKARFFRERVKIRACSVFGTISGKKRVRAQLFDADGFVQHGILL